MENKHYYRIDVIGENGFSICMATDKELNIDEVLDYAVQNDVIDKWDIKYDCVQAEEITNDEDEMNVWADDAVFID